MSRPSSSLRLAFGALVPSLLCACIIVTNDDIPPEEDTTDTNPTNPTNPTTGLPSDTTSTPTTDSATGLDDTGTTGDDTGETTGGLPGECTENLLLDPGFEAGTPSTVWNEDSTLFGTPICDASCTEETGAVPYAGSWWVWLGGVTDQVEVGSVSHTHQLPEMAYLGFWLWIRSSAGTGDDVFTVTVDGETVFMVVDTDMAEYDEYTHVTVDITPYADGGDHEIAFIGDLAGSGLTSFFLDETSLVSCVESSGSSGSDSGSGTSTGAEGSSTGGGSSSGSGSSSG